MLTYSAVGLPTWVLLSPSGKLKVLPSAPVGSYTLDVSVNDGSASYSRAIVVNVAARVVAPYFAVSLPLLSSAKIKLSAGVSVAFVPQAKSKVNLSAAISTKVVTQSNIGARLKLTALPQTVVPTASLRLRLSCFSGQVFSTSIATLRGSQGLTALITGQVDDSARNVGDLGFDFMFNGTNHRTSTFICANSYVTFGSGSTVYSGYSATYPQPGVYVGANDPFMNMAYAGQISPTSYLIRYEGINRGNGGTVSNSFWEVTLYSSGKIMLVTGTLHSDFLNGFSCVTNLTTAGAVFFGQPLAQNSSYVFTPGPTTAEPYTVQTGSIVEL